MDNHYNQSTNANPNQQNAYQQGNPNQQNAYQQGNPNQQNAYQQGDFAPQSNTYQQTNAYTNNSYGNYGSAYNSGSGQDPQKAPNIFQQFILSFIPTQYDRLTKVRTGSMIGFVTLLALIATILSFAVLAVGFASIDGQEWLSVLPDFEIADGRLYIENDFVYDEAGMFVYLTDEINGFSYDDASSIAAEGYRNIILAGRDRISIMQNGEYQQTNFRNLGSDMEISKTWIVETLMPIMMVLISIGYIFFFVGRIFWYFLCAAVYLLFAMLIASLMKKKQPAGALFRVAVYSKVLMFVVATLLSVVPFVSFSVPFILRVVITLGFMGVAVAKLPDNN